MEPDGGGAGDARPDAAGDLRPDVEVGAGGVAGDGPEVPVYDASFGVSDQASPADAAVGDGRAADAAADGAGSDAPLAVTCRSDDAFVQLPFPASMIGYSRARDRLVVVPSYPYGAPPAPHVVHIIDPETCSDVTLPLPMAPLGLSVSPDGRMAAVGHNARLTGIDLMEERITGTFLVSATTGNVKVDNQRRAHTFDPRENFATSNWLTVDLMSGQVETGAMVQGSLRMTVHPGGKRGYLHDGSYGEIIRVDLSGPRAMAPNRGTRLDYAHCGRLMPSDDGARLFTGCHWVLRSSDTTDQDLSYDGTVEGVRGVLDLAMDSAAGLLVILPGAPFSWDPGDQGGRLRIHETRYLNLVKEVVLPPMPGATTPGSARASRVFLRSDARRIYALVSADGSSFGRQAILRVQP